MAFRRNIKEVGKGQTRRKAIVLVGAIVAIFVLTKLILDTWGATEVHVIQVEMLSRDVFVVAGDTTNYDNFASILKKEVIQAKKTYPSNQIQLQLPEIEKSNEITDVIMVITAMDLDWNIQTKIKDND